MAGIEITITGALGERKLEEVLETLRKLSAREAPQPPAGDIKLFDEEPAKPLGTKAVPHVGELWLTRGGGVAAIVKYDICGPSELLWCVLLTQGNTAVSIPREFNTSVDGRFVNPGRDHPNDLVKLHGSFLTP